MVRSLASWLWLLDFRNTAKALDASDDGSGELSAELGEHFAEIHSLRADAERLAELRTSNERQGWVPTSLGIGNAFNAPWPNGTFDCIALHDVLTRHGYSDHELSRILIRYHQLMRTDGWISISSPISPSLRRGKRDSQTVPPRRMSAILNEAGFSEVRCLWIEHSNDRPLFMVPDDPRTLVAYESYDAVRGSGSRARRAATKFGLSTILYPAYLLLARA
jgi:hypothetical protein